MHRTIIGLLGGTFDPFHLGHLKLALAAHDDLQLDALYLIPAGQSLLKGPPVAHAAQRVHMLNLVSKAYNWMQVDLFEINKQAPTYTIETVSVFRARFPSASLCFIISMDQFLQLDQWHKWQDLLTYVHLIVANRPDYVLKPNAVLDEWLKHQTLGAVYNEPFGCKKNGKLSLDLKILRKTSAGCVYFYQFEALEIASTFIRNQIKQGQHAQIASQLPDDIYNYILKEKLYFPCITS